MRQGRAHLEILLSGRALWPPGVVAFGVDPFGWHGERASYREVCASALERCTLLPKVLPIPHPLCVGGEGVRIGCAERTEEESGARVRQHTLQGPGAPFTMVEVQTPGDSSWKTRKRWIETEEELERFLAMDLAPAQPDLEAVRRKERQVGGRGLPYVEVADPFGVVAGMFPTKTFYVKLLADRERVIGLLETAGRRVLSAVETLCREAGCPFILRLTGAELAVPPFLRRADFLELEGPFYRRVAAMARDAGIPAGFHCHGPVGEIMEDIWGMGFAVLEPFEPPPRGNVPIGEALAAARGRGVVLGGVDEVLLHTGSREEVRAAVEGCLREARAAGGPYILSQSATPFFEPLEDRARENLLLMMELGARG